MFGAETRRIASGDCTEAALHVEAVLVVAPSTLCGTGRGVPGVSQRPTAWTDRPSGVSGIPRSIVVAVRG